MMLAAIIANAQTIKNGSSWFSGWINFDADIKAGGKIFMSAMDEGQEIEFTLIPVKGKAGEYTVGDGVTDGAVNPYSKVKKVKYKSQNGLEALCFYTSGTDLQAVLVRVGVNDDATDLATNQWIRQHLGEYKSADGRIALEWKNNVMVVNDISAHYTLVTFNGRVTGAITINGGEMDGIWEVVSTLEGVKFYATVIDEYGMRSRTGKSIEFIESDPNTGRFAYANNVLLNDRWFMRMKKSTLRIMRNEIMAHHGYVFQSEDLKEYFANEPWYKPDANNKAKLTFVEELNLELIKCVENSPDADKYTEE